ncbi:MAG: GNAT family N-acetyltransferase, partial [Traorella sp.]
PLFFDYHKDHFDYQKDVICLVHPSIDYLDEINAFRLEMLEANDADGFAGCGGLEKYENIEEWMHQVKLRESEKTLPKGMVSSNVYLAIRIEDHHLVGIIDLRHHINHPILQKWGGHIGYSVRPSERRKGIAKEMLRLDLMQVKKLGIKRVLVTCSSTNAASRKVILANNGKFENSIEVNKDIIERYWIEVNHE